MNLLDVYTQLQNQLKLELPFVIYRKPKSEIIKVISQNDNSLNETGDFKTPGFVFAPFNKSHKSILLPLSKSESITVSYKLETTEAKKQFKKTFDDNNDSNFTKEAHKQLIEKGINALNSDFKKVVLSRKEQLRLIEDSNCFDMFHRILHQYPNAFTYLWYHPNVGMWLGATPESLMNINNSTISTMALAATQPYVNTKNVSWGNKEIKEQEMVASYVTHELEPFVNELTSSKTYTHRAGNLLHLRTDITGTLKSSLKSLSTVVNVLHPTPAVCGLPKERANTFIINNENYDRKYYTGYLGEILVENNNSTQTDLFVNLRCMEIIEDAAILYIGGGITKDSHPDKEWIETVKKSETMKQVLF